MWRWKPGIPVHCGVVLPNINKHEYIEKKLDRVIGADKVFFWDDLHPESDICRDSTGKCFFDTLKDKFPPQFPFALTGSELSYLRQLIFPSVQIELPERKREGGYAAHLKHVQILDHNQEALARKFDSGHWIIMGPSGSGKTIILVHRAAFLKRYNPSIKNILFVCYNITLVNYIRRLLANKKIPLGQNGVEVMHFFELCAKITGEKFSYDSEGETFYKMMIQERKEEK
jgi:superfamily I DNA and RNA helicase